jgi:hypothetical protein
MTNHNLETYRIIKTKNSILAIFEVIRKVITTREG